MKYVLKVKPWAVAQAIALLHVFEKLKVMTAKLLGGVSKLTVVASGDKRVVVQTYDEPVGRVEPNHGFIFAKKDAQGVVTLEYRETVPDPKSTVYYGRYISSKDGASYSRVSADGKKLLKRKTTDASTFFEYGFWADVYLVPDANGYAAGMFGPYPLVELPTLPVTRLAISGISTAPISTSLWRYSAGPTFLQADGGLDVQLDTANKKCHVKACQLEFDPVYVGVYKRDHGVNEGPGIPTGERRIICKNPVRLRWSEIVYSTYEYTVDGVKHVDLVTETKPDKVVALPYVPATFKYIVGAAVRARYWTNYPGAIIEEITLNTKHYVDYATVAFGAALASYVTLTPQNATPQASGYSVNYQGGVQAPFDLYGMTMLTPPMNLKATQPFTNSYDSPWTTLMFGLNNNVRGMYVFDVENDLLFDTKVLEPSLNKPLVTIFGRTGSGQLIFSIHNQSPIGDGGVYIGETKCCTIPTNCVIKPVTHGGVVRINGVEFLVAAGLYYTGGYVSSTSVFLLDLTTGSTFEAVKSYAAPLVYTPDASMNGLVELNGEWCLFVTQLVAASPTREVVSYFSLKSALQGIHKEVLTVDLTTMTYINPAYHYKHFPTSTLKNREYGPYLDITIPL